MGSLMNPSNYSLRDHLPLIWKNFVFFPHRLITRTPWVSLFMFFTGFTSFMVVFLLPQLITIFFSWKMLVQIWCYFIKHQWISLNQPLCKHAGYHGTGRPCDNFSRTTYLAQTVNFPTCIPDSDSHIQTFFGSVS